MQAIYHILIEPGVSDHRIHAESFGPAALTGRTDQPRTPQETATAKEAIVEFTDSKVEQA